MHKNLIGISLLCLFVILYEPLSAQKEIAFEKYHNNSEVQQILKNLQLNHPAQLWLLSYCRSTLTQERNKCEN